MDCKKSIAQILFYPKNSFVQKKSPKKIRQKIILPKIMYYLPLLPFPNMDHKSPKMLQNFGVFQKIKKSAKLPNLDKRPQLHIMSVFTYSFFLKGKLAMFFLQEKLFSTLIFVFLFSLLFRGELMTLKSIKNVATILQHCQHQ